MSVRAEDERWMGLALEQARLTAESADVPVGAILVDSAGTVVATGFNLKEARHDPTAHAEIEAIRAATAARGDWQLRDLTLVVTLEPCIMCAGAILAARIPRVVFGAWEDKAGAAGSAFDLLRDRRLAHRAEVVGGVREAECAAILVEFFRETLASPTDL
ncbi:tRNA(adenine34) deaminase [Mycetocola sp. BIGb0189]|uniref:tRNA adenosine(34) deaminase TadA n=1 Tax=Mycetocola sp. BIGb0189 TaxID=2940604 RepID=UPI0021681467|nr:tRNA adenosine(34) deaminase TadA [Mycetocola sp. BIGb0189]MCS4276437.1 tRNA(adenine34) deaminase [Mycetocola sp. BIGb0189]